MDVIALSFLLLENLENFLSHFVSQKTQKKHMSLVYSLSLSLSLSLSFLFFFLFLIYHFGCPENFSKSRH
jgi:hypothetical protein